METVDEECAVSSTAPSRPPVVRDNDDDDDDNRHGADRGGGGEKAQGTARNGSKDDRANRDSKNRLSVVSAKYDRNQKGYLDDTERKLRDLDSQNLGYVDLDKMYGVVQQLQREQKKSVTLKMTVAALGAFSILLAVANIGTSFAAATLAKDTTTSTSSSSTSASSTSSSASRSSNSDLIDVRTKQRVGTTSKVDVVHAVEQQDPEQRRRLGQLPGRRQQGRRRETVETKRLGPSAFVITSNDADSLFRSLCNAWPGMTDWLTNSGNTDGNDVACGSTSATQNAFVDHCGYRTKLDYVRAPSLKETTVTLNDGTAKTNRAIEFAYDGYRGGWNYGPVKVHCAVLQQGNEDSGAASPPTISQHCVVTGLNCDQVCRVCTTTGTDARWFCPSGTSTSNYACGCFPGERQCVELERGRTSDDVACLASCYSPTVTAQAPAAL